MEIRCPPHRWPSKSTRSINISRNGRKENGWVQAPNPHPSRTKRKQRTLKGATGWEECWSVENRRASKARVRRKPNVGRKRTALGWGRGDLGQGAVETNKNSGHRWRDDCGGEEKKGEVRPRHLVAPELDFYYGSFGVSLLARARRMRLSRHATMRRCDGWLTTPPTLASISGKPDVSASTPHLSFSSSIFILFFFFFHFCTRRRPFLWCPRFDARRCCEFAASFPPGS